MKLFYHIGKYFFLLRKIFRRPQSHSIYLKQILREMISLGIGSLGIICIISFFMGAVITIQSGSNMQDAWIPLYAIGYTVRQSVVLEFASTVMALILAGKVGSNIASEMGTMRITEQIDALEIMGINSASFLILPKIFGLVLMMPFIVIISMFVSMIGGWLASIVTNIVSGYEYIYGLQYGFDSFGVTYALIKSLFFAFAITSIPAYHGYYVNIKGGALEVGAASTRAVVYTSIMILILNYVITQLLLI